MNYKGYASLALSLLVIGVAGAAQDPGSAAAAARPVPNITPEQAIGLAEAGPPEGTAPLLPPSSNGIVPDPAASSAVPRPDAGQGSEAPGYAAQPAPVQLPPALAPPNTCDTADCPAPGERRWAAKKVPPVHIGPPAQRALADSHAWAENPAAVPTRDSSGRVLYTFSESVPTIVCAPLHVCDIELQAGEVIQGAPHIGDGIRWRISPAVSGSEESRVIHLIVKPTEPGLDTNLIIATDRHTYHLRLVSSTTSYVSSVGFYYPEEQQQAWTEFAKATHSGAAAGGGVDMPTVAVNRLNFNYRIKVVKGKPSFKPLRAMDDGYHTYIAMNEDLPQREAPVLIGINAAGTEQMINYRLKGNLYVIDGTVFKMAFISGVGKEQERIELTRDACTRRGWLGICWDAEK
jgi:type IV secretion system protein VirB9